jgi:uncharacterized membrane protein YraQ (UPF0718 family)
VNIALYIITVFALAVSFLKNRNKTVKALKMAGKRILKISPLFLATMGLYAILVSFAPLEKVTGSLESYGGALGLFAALLVGSIALMPGFVAFPLCALLQQEGVPYFILATFSVSLMCVGIATFPIETKYLGVKVTIIRNIIGVVVSIITGIILGLAFGEIVL